MADAILDQTYAIKRPIVLLSQVSKFRAEKCSAFRHVPDLFLPAENRRRAILLASDFRTGSGNDARSRRKALCCSALPYARWSDRLRPRRRHRRHRRIRPYRPEVRRVSSR